MRLVIATLVSWFLLAALPAMAADPGSDEPAAEDEDSDAVTREDVERKKRELREMERELREQESAKEAERIQEELRARRESARDGQDPKGLDGYERHRRPRDAGRLWFGVGTGVGYGSVEVTCSGSGLGAECTEEGLVNTFIGNVTVSSPSGLTGRLRGIRDSDKGDDARTPYEVAALMGTRFGSSSWYGMAGYGRVYHADDRFPRDHSGGIAWEIFFAPETDGPVGLELGFQGNNGHYVDYVAFNVGMRFGALR